MSDKTEALKIRFVPPTHRVDAEAPRLRFLRWRLVPLPAVEHEARENDLLREAEWRSP